MMHVRQELPGLDRIRDRFIEMLADRQTMIAHHALLAWEGETVEAVNENLYAAQCVLHQIGGTAGSLGFDVLGKDARTCEMEIIAHLEGPDADLAICPGDLIYHVDNFVGSCRALLDLKG